VNIVKIAISVDKELVKVADAAARKRAVSRGRLFSIALDKYLHDRCNEGMLEKLNRIYAGEASPQDRRIVPTFKSRLRSVLKNP
jgi:metal-responsive CopG/Arc/MetJ family transcriptional regulator